MMEDMMPMMCGLVVILVLAVVLLVGIVSSLSKDVTRLSYEVEVMSRTRSGNTNSCGGCLVLLFVVGLVGVVGMLLATTVIATPFP